MEGRRRGLGQRHRASFLQLNHRAGMQGSKLTHACRSSGRLTGGKVRSTLMPCLPTAPISMGPECSAWGSTQ